MNLFVSVAGGLIAVYIIFALITAHVVEYINGVMNSRGKLLYQGILEMLSGTKDGKPPANAPGAAAGVNLGQTITDAIYAHPLVGNLGLKSRPSYIAARTFTLTLVSALQDRATPAGPAAPHPPLSATPDDLLTDLRARVNGLEDGKLKASLTLILQQTQNTYDSALKAIDDWYEAQMDRIAGTYKRYAAGVQAIVAAVVVVGFNVDTFGILKQLAASATAAQALGSSAQAFTNDTTIQAALQALVSAHVNIGWQGASGISAGQIGGWLLTWLAVLLGAPFWFDILKQFVPVRQTGTVPDADAASKGDKQATSMFGTQA
jgi:hypothetical protein